MREFRQPCWREVLPAPRQPEPNGPYSCACMKPSCSHRWLPPTPVPCTRPTLCPTVERLQRRVRDHRAGYAQSLGVLRRVREVVPHVITKTSLMLGVGETPEEIRATMRDCLDAGVQVGQGVGWGGW